MANFVCLQFCAGQVAFSGFIRAFLPRTAACCVWKRRSWEMLKSWIEVRGAAKSSDNICVLTLSVHLHVPKMSLQRITIIPHTLQLYGNDKLHVNHTYIGLYVEALHCLNSWPVTTVHLLQPTCTFSSLLKLPTATRWQNWKITCTVIIYIQESSNFVHLAFVVIWHLLGIFFSTLLLAAV